MIDTTTEILTRYPFQVLLLAVVLRGTLRAALEGLAGGRKGAPRPKPDEAATQAV